jgi:hypothetical protein
MKFHGFEIPNKILRTGKLKDATSSEIYGRPFFRFSLIDDHELHIKIHTDFYAISITHNGVAVYHTECSGTLDTVNDIIATKIVDYFERLHDTPNTPNTPQAKTSACPSFDQIPLSALIALAKRYELGEKKYGRDNWRKSLTDKMYVVERLNHVIMHAKTLQGKLLGEIPWDEDDDAGAILWGGAFCAEAARVSEWGKEINNEIDL